MAIRLNYDKTNFEEICELIDFLAKYFPNKKLLTVYAHPLTYNSLLKGCVSRSELKTFHIEIMNKLIQNGFIKSFKDLGISPKRVACSAPSIRNYCISPIGTIFKCTHDFDYPELSVGNIYVGITANNALLNWTDSQLSAECVTCLYLPLCMGGCKQAKDSALGRCFINKTIMDDLIELGIEKLNEGGNI